MTEVKCPTCGSDRWRISAIATFKEGQYNITTYRCSNCQSTWNVEEPIEEEKDV